jgi:hypothetical protein
VVRLFFAEILCYDGTSSSSGAHQAMLHCTFTLCLTSVVQHVLTHCSASYKEILKSKDEPLADEIRDRVERYLPLALGVINAPFDDLPLASFFLFLHRVMHARTF